MSEFKPGDTVTFEIDAEIVARYQSGRVKLQWHSGEETIYESDGRIK